MTTHFLCLGGMRHRRSLVRLQNLMSHTASLFASEMLDYHSTGIVDEGEACLGYSSYDEMTPSRIKRVAFFATSNCSEVTSKLSGSSVADSSSVSRLPSTNNTILRELARVLRLAEVPCYHEVNMHANVHSVCIGQLFSLCQVPVHSPHIRHTVSTPSAQRPGASPHRYWFKLRSSPSLTTYNNCCPAKMVCGLRMRSLGFQIELLFKPQFLNEGASCSLNSLVRFRST